jgi:ParB family chromosome partitioning protein
MGMLDDPLLAVDAPEAEPAQAAQASPAGADSSQPVAIAPAPAGQFIGISLIDPSPFQPRLEFTDEDIAALADTILYQGGLLNPIIVRAKADGRYELIAGERRTRAHKLLGKEEIQARVVELDDMKAAAVVFADNEAAKPTTDYEKARGIQTLMDMKVFESHAQLSKYTGVNRGSISRLMSFFRLPKEVIEILDEYPSLIGSTAAAKMAAYVDDYREIVIKAAQKINDATLKQGLVESWIKNQIRKERPRTRATTVGLPHNRFGFTDASVSGKNVLLRLRHGEDPYQAMEMFRDWLVTRDMAQASKDAPTPAREAIEPAADDTAALPDSTQGEGL